MKTTIFFSTFFFMASFSFAQCNLDFGTGKGFTFSKVNSTDIVNGSSSGANATSSQSFDIWDETTGSCSTPGGVDDVTIDFEIFSTVDQYNPGDIIDLWAGGSHEITQSSSGLRGFIPLGSAAAAETTSGDVRCYSITVTFAPHVDITADEIIVNMNSVNTVGAVFETASLVFLDALSAPANSPFGSATYNGFYGVGSAGPSTDGTCTSIAPTTTVYSEVGPGVFTMANTGTVDLTLPCDPTGGSSSPLDGKDVNAHTDTGLPANAQIGGFVYKVCLEDVAGSTAPLDETTTSTGFSSTLNSISIVDPLPVDLIDFNAKVQDDEVDLEWITASEENNSHFEIEYSENGRDFNYLDKIEGVGTSAEIQHYTYTHLNPMVGRNYYRLRQVDLDGDFTYSSIVSAVLSSTTAIEIYPTLVANTLQVSLEENRSTDIEMRVVDITGRQLQSTIISKGTEGFDLDVVGLERGTYFVQFNIAGEVVTRRFVKI